MNLMAENGGGGGGGAGGGGVVRVGKAAVAGPGTLTRPTITLPSFSSFESLFHGGAGGASEVSPGPLTLVSSFLAEESESDCCSFTQLLVGAINSPVAAAKRTIASSGEQGMEAEKRSSGRKAESGGGLVRLGQSPPPGLAISQPQMFTVPPGLSPAGLLDSPAFLSSGLGNFATSHQEALAQVTAQAAQSQFRMQSEAEFPASFLAATTSSSQQPIPEIPTIKPTYTAEESVEGSQSAQRLESNTAIVDRNAHDGYNWRKYGQKAVKGSEYPRSYYKCTHPKCPVKKKVECSVDGQVTEIIYKGQHNHQCPIPNKRTKEANSFPGGLNGMNENIDNPKPGSLPCHGHFGKRNDITAAPISRRDQESDHGKPEQLSGSSDSEEGAEIRTDEGDVDERDPKRRNMPASSHRTLSEPRIIVQTTSEVDLLDDGYRWRKYGQKVVKGNPNPRSYYKCTYAGCNVRKHIERSPTDTKAVITSYEGKHNHDIPAARNSSHNTVSVGTASSNAVSDQASLASSNFRNQHQRPVAILQLKEEHENT
ncbi:WRKY transcription factor [Musa troglodytarum]|uniref:WRKY transcription factor n=1 Tax=Musa troglodytarum TaxID=320322 RepID=A0A9E7JY93_9LILI|nr:WRKY transcription factor [Musa troglodytarum]